MRAAQKNPPMHTTILRAALLAAATLCLIATAARAAVTLPSLFTNRMVLQRDQPIKIWGKAAPGEKVTVTFADKTATTTAGSSGRWLATLPPMPASAKPRSLKITSSEIPNPSSEISNLKSETTTTTTITNVLVGDVWLASGQSNMFFQLRQTVNAQETIAASANPNIRYFDVPRTVADEPQFTTKSQWVDCTPKTSGRFSAVAFHFAQQLQRDLDIPVAIIHASWGGTNAEAWTPRDILAASPITAGIITKWDATMRDFPKIKADFEASKDRLDAEWKLACEKAAAEGRMPPAAPRLRTGPGTQYQPAGLYNAMIAPLAPYAIRGVIWYQGEGNAPRPVQYRALFPAMINSWRALWDRPDLPFLFVQLPNLARQPEPSKSGWAEIREAQLRALALPHTAMAVTIDVGDPKNLHPANKLPVGQRLAYAAEALCGQRPPATAICPYPAKYHIKGNEIRVTLTPAGITLKTSDNAVPRGLVIAAADKKFVPACTRIEGNTLVIWSDEIKSPAAARHAWADNPDRNLVSAAGLPVSPFRTDSWPTPASENEAAAAAFPSNN
jgi:sialate O-acetylesterase